MMSRAADTYTHAVCLPDFKSQEFGRYIHTLMPCIYRCTFKHVCIVLYHCMYNFAVVYMLNLGNPLLLWLLINPYTHYMTFCGEHLLHMLAGPSEMVRLVQPWLHPFLLLSVRSQLAALCNEINRHNVTFVLPGIVSPSHI